MWAVVGLGNPGSRYARTRHNLGFMVVDAVAARAAVRLAPDARFDWVRTTWCEQPLVLMKPRTYVNRSGEAVGELLSRLQVGWERLLVVVDDIHLPFGRLRLRPSGSAGGHNGLRSIEAAVESRDYARLRVGVGSPEGAWADHVLSSFDADQVERLPQVVEDAADAVRLIVTRGVAWARPRINARPATDDA